MPGSNLYSLNPVLNSANPILNKLNPIKSELDIAKEKTLQNLQQWNTIQEKYRQEEEALWNSKKDTEYKNYIRTIDPNSSWGSVWAKKETIVNPVQVEQPTVRTETIKKPVAKTTSIIIPDWDQKMLALNYEKLGDYYRDLYGNAYYNNGRVWKAGAKKGENYNVDELTADIPFKLKNSYSNQKQFRNDIGMLWGAAFRGTGFFPNSAPGKEDPRYQAYINRAYRLYKQAHNQFKQGGKMDRINYFQQGGLAPQQNLQDLVIQLVQTAMDQQNPNSAKAAETINQIMLNAKSGDEKSIQLAQMIQQVMQQMKKSAKWGSKLEYIKSLKFKKGGKACPACMEKGDTILVNGLYPKHWTPLLRMEYDRKHPTDETKSADENHKARLLEKKKHQPKKQVEKKDNGSKTVKKRYFGGWL